MDDPTAPLTSAVQQLAPEGVELGPLSYKAVRNVAPRLVDEGYLPKGPNADSNSIK